MCISSTCAMATLILSLLLWILTIGAIAASGCMETERNALLTFRAGLVDPRNLLSSWEGGDCCKWRGVVCGNTTGHVVKLNLRASYDTFSGQYLRLSGEINPSLILLTNLEHLDLNMNNFSGPNIPTFMGSFKNLRYLNLAYTYFSGAIPPQIGNLSKLHSLDLSFVSTISGTLQVDDILWLTHLSSLKYLDLSGVNFNTSTDWLHAVNMLPSLKVLHLVSCSLHGISTSLSHVNFTSLNVLDLEDNFINSTLPTWLRNLTSITYLDLSSNEFHGVISEEFQYLSTLNVLNLGYNGFKGMAPKALRYLCNLTTLGLSSLNIGGEIMEWVERQPRCMRDNLQTLSLSDNNLKGNLSGWLEQMNSLEDIDLESNLLTGSIPAGVWKLPNLISLDLYNNSLEGVISNVELSYLKKVQYLDLSHNSLIVRVHDDWVPPFQLKGIGLASCQLGPNFPAWLKNQSQLEWLDLSKNKITDKLPSWFWNISNFIYHIRLSNNQINGRLPVLMGSTMLLHNLEFIDLSNNFITGVLPNAILPQLSYLFLSNNGIDGTIPSTLCESTFLEALVLSNNSLSGQIPECIGKSQEQLFIIDVSKNNLTGAIPDSVCSPEYVLLLKFSSNGLSGEFPPLQNCTSLVILDLGDNKFSGAIPLWIGENLTNLTILDLHSNMFSGSIPPQLARLGYLQILDLSGNNLSGQIPRSFGNFTWRALKEGRKDRIDNTLDDPSIYIGNPYLCGPPSSRNCSSNEVDYKDNEGSKDKFEWLWVYFGVVLGYLFGFAVICGVLLLNNAWRDAYFSMIDIVYDKLCIVTKGISTRVRQIHRR